jgi:MFS family permease
MADLTKPELRFRVFSMRYLAINIGVAVGPLLGAYFGMISGGLPFTITGFVYLIYAILLQILLKRFGIKKIEGEKEMNAETITFRKAWHVIRHDVTFRLFLMGGMIASIGYSQMTVSLAQYLQQNFVGGVTIFAAMMSTNALVVVVFQVPIVHWIEKRTPIFAIVLGNIMFALGDIGYAFSVGWITFITSMIVFTFGEILTYPAANLLIDRLAPTGMRGTYYGAQTFQNFGAFVGPWLGGLLLISFGGSVLFTIIAVITLSSVSLYWLGVKTTTGSKRKLIEE